MLLLKTDGHGLKKLRDCHFAVNVERLADYMILKDRRVPLELNTQCNESVFKVVTEFKLGYDLTLGLKGHFMQHPDEGK